MATTLTIGELRAKYGRIEIFVGKLMRGDPFITKNDKQVYANSLSINSPTGKVLEQFTPFNPQEADKLIRYLRNGAPSSGNIVIYEKGREGNYTSLKDLKITGEFGFKGKSYSVNKEPYEVSQLRRQLAKAIAQNKGPIGLMINNIKYYDVCDVIASNTTSTYRNKSDFEFIDRYGNSMVWVFADFDGDTEDQAQLNRQIFSQTEVGTQFIEDLQQKYPEGFTPEVSFFRKFPNTTDGVRAKMKAAYGPYYDGSKRYNAQNVTMICDGSVTLAKGSGGMYKITASNVKYNGDGVFGTVEPVMQAIYKPGSNDFGIRNASINISHINKAMKEF